MFMILRNVNHNKIVYMHVCIYIYICIVMYHHAMKIAVAMTLLYFKDRASTC